MKTFFLSLIFLVVSYNSFSQTKNKKEELNINITAIGVFNNKVSSAGGNLAFLSNPQKPSQIGIAFGAVGFGTNGGVGFPISINVRGKFSKKELTPIADMQAGFFIYSGGNNSFKTKGGAQANIGLGVLANRSKRFSPYFMIKYNMFELRDFVNNRLYQKRTLNLASICIGLSINN